MIFTIKDECMNWPHAFSSSRSIQEKTPVKSREEKLSAFAAAAISKQAPHLCRVVG